MFNIHFNTHAETSRLQTAHVNVTLARYEYSMATPQRGSTVGYRMNIQWQLLKKEAQLVIV